MLHHETDAHYFSDWDPNPPKPLSDPKRYAERVAGLALSALLHPNLVTARATPDEIKIYQQLYDEMKRPHLEYGHELNRQWEAELMREMGIDPSALAMIDLEAREAA